METLSDGRIRCRVKIKGSFRGEAFEYIDPIDSEGSQFIWPVSEDHESDYERASGCWWDEGNMGCDCNRCQFVGVELECGDEILIDTIEPVEGDGTLPTLVLNETEV